MTLRDGLIAARGQIAFLVGLIIAMGFVIYIERHDSLTNARQAALTDVCDALHADADWPDGHPLPSICRDG